MLRTTVETFAGAVGGGDSMNVSPFDATIRQPDEFSRRVARNQQLILQAESNLSRIADPAGGAWYVELLTDWLARTAWASFQQIEAAGGMFAALQTGELQQQVAAIMEQRRANVERRKDVRVGTNMYPNLQEDALSDTTDYSAIYQERVEEVSRYRAKRGTDPSYEVTDLENALEAAAAGATLGELSASLWQNNAEQPTITSFTPQRLSEPFEALRRAASDYAAQVGHLPQIFLANMGPPRQHRARAEFTIGFFEIGGFELLSNAGFASTLEAAEAALKSGASVVVICSTDDTYPEIVPALVQLIKAKKPEIYIILAGYPRDQIAAYQATGVNDFIHIRSNCYQMNQKMQQHMGVRS
jgi:methylmalonyl-CoA mutase